MHVHMPCTQKSNKKKVYVLQLLSFVFCDHRIRFLQKQLIPYMLSKKLKTCCALSFDRVIIKTKYAHGMEPLQSIGRCHDFTDI